MTKLRIGVASVAHHHAENYLTLLSRRDDVTLVGFSDEDPRRAEAAADATGAEHLGSRDQLLDQSLDAVLICSENARHRADIDAAARAGTHILCEKPLATTADDALAALEICARNDVILRTAFPIRHSPRLLSAKRLVDSHVLGDIRAIEGWNQGSVPTDSRPWFIDRALSGGGSLIDHTPHLVDAYRWLLDDEVAQVYAQAGGPVGDDGVETSSLMVLTFSRGVVATIDCSWSRPRTYPTWGGLDLRVIGADGITHVDAFPYQSTHYDDISGAVRWIDWGDDPNAAMLDDFLAVVAGTSSSSSTTSALDGLRTAEVTDAAYKSIRTGQPVDIRPARPPSA